MHAPEFDARPAPRGVAGIACFGLETIAAALLVVIGVLLFGSTVLRYFGSGDPRAFEFLRVAFVYLVGIAGVAAYARHENIVVPGVWRQETVSYQVACALVSGAVTWLTARYIGFTGWERELDLADGLARGDDLRARVPLRGRRPRHQPRPAGAPAPQGLSGTVRVPGRRRRSARSARNRSRSGRGRPCATRRRRPAFRR